MIRKLLLIFVVSISSIATADWKTIEDHWYGASIAGAKSGWVHTTVEQEGDMIRSSTLQQLSISRGEIVIELEISSEFIETRGGEPVSVHTVQKAMGQVMQFLTEETKKNEDAVAYPRPIEEVVDVPEVKDDADKGKVKEATKKPVKPIPKITIVTGGAGFIGSHLIEKLNNRGNERILLVDDLSHPDKLQNIKDLKFQDYCDISKFPDLFMFMAEKQMVDQVFHLGADSNVNCDDGKHMMENNYQYTCNIMDICHMGRIPLVYASSSAVYGQQTKEWGTFDDKSDDYVPESYYALAKLQADRYSRKFMSQGPDKTKIIGLRYFNVISDGKREQHKGDMKSPTAWMKEQYDETGMIRLFKDSAEMYRDFVPVDDVAHMTINAMTSGRSGVYNIGTGESRSFLELALEVVDNDESKITYFNMPYDMQDRYQMFTQANMDNACFGIMSRP